MRIHHWMSVTLIVAFVVVLGHSKWQHHRDISRYKKKIAEYEKTIALQQRSLESQLRQMNRNYIKAKQLKISKAARQSQWLDNKHWHLTAPNYY